MKHTGVWWRSLALMGGMGWGLFPASVIASPCFMINRQGQKIDLGTLCRSAQPSPSSSRTVQAPILRRQRGIPVVVVALNGRPYEMILDTGASNTLITLPMAQQLAIPLVGQISGTVADGRRVQFPVGLVRSIAIGRAIAQDVPVAVSDRLDIGLLGQDFLANFDLRIGRNFIELSQR
ncbi:MAG: clan AA aspartic protease [Oscillatoriales cyanobacterium SM2_2_1]|nr:clan AA aspartic protease [Oscillatoriales cyanobacterium SM2_2_1]